jgi:cystathionine beta-lyase
MGASRAFALSSGMTALDLITRFVSTGQEIIAGNDLYGGTHRLLQFLSKQLQIKVHHVDTTDPNEVLRVLDPDKTRLVLLESPTNPLIKICDIPRISSKVHQLAPLALVVVDNTMVI